MRARFWILLSALLVFANNGSAALWDDPSAMPYYQGSTTFFSMDGKFNGSVDYAVYEPGYFNSAITDYVYAYQVFNDQSSTAGIDFFSVVDLSGVSWAWCEPISRGEQLGSFSSAVHLQNSVLYYFPDAVEAGEHSWTLLFRSDSAPCWPDWENGVIAGGAAGSVNRIVPSPVPEPATLILLFSGAFMALRGRRKI